MADEKDPRIITPIPKPLLARIDDYRFENRLPSRSEAIRRLIEAGLKAKTDPQRSGTSPGRSSKPGGDQDAERGAPKPSPPRKPAPRAKTAAMSKEAQIRVLR